MVTINELKRRGRAALALRQTVYNIEAADRWHFMEELRNELYERFLGYIEKKGFDLSEFAPAIKFRSVEQEWNKALRPCYPIRVTVCFEFPGHTPITSSYVFERDKVKHIKTNQRWAIELKNGGYSYAQYLAYALLEAEAQFNTPEAGGYQHIQKFFAPTDCEEDELCREEENNG